MVTGRAPDGVGWSNSQDRAVTNPQSRAAAAVPWSQVREKVADSCLSVAGRARETFPMS